ncbi:MAG TPA: tRNA lysidine(34) synthetase TilS [Gemmatimonadaceae bacterium]|nr:tRNA lysidine(34) synthetase TilS [Gemmatimonadaceae bacterium]
MSVHLRSASHEPGAQSALSGIDVVDAAARSLVRSTIAERGRLALAVSGGCDSMVLMRAVHRAAIEHDGAAAGIHVLSFDHGTGVHSAAAADLVAAEAKSLGLGVTIGRGQLAGGSEAKWRDARWAFLRDARAGATIATAHTLDDQIETVVMRTLRAAGARGIAGLIDSRDVVRPLVGVSRDAVRRYAAINDVRFAEDPSNASPAYMRNRIRGDLLPAIRRSSPTFETEILALAARASVLRDEIDAIVEDFMCEAGEDELLRVARQELATYDSAALCVLWQAIAARAQVTLDRRGTLRLAQFTTSGAPGARIQLSGGVEVFRHRQTFVLRRMVNGAALREMSLAGAVQFGDWYFRPVDGVKASARPDVRTERSVTRSSVGQDDPWTFDAPTDRPLMVRAWRPADRMRVRHAGPARRVKRFFGDAQVAGPSREGWPVVLADGEIVWIPGVRRGAAATARSGRPVVRYVCERSRGDHSNR